VLHRYFKFKGKRREHSLRTTHEWVARIKAKAETTAIKARAQEQDRLKRLHQRRILWARLDTPSTHKAFRSTLSFNCGPSCIGGDGWESNPPGTLLSPTMVLKTRSATRSPYASGETNRAAGEWHRRKAPLECLLRGESKDI
jgi:hypothetical protein